MSSAASRHCETSMKIFKIPVAVFILGFLALGPSMAHAQAIGADAEKTLETLRSKVGAASASMLVNGIDLQVRFPYAPLVAAVTKINNRPEVERTIALQSTAVSGNLWADSPTWCNSSLYLARAEGLRGSAILSGFNAAAEQDGSLSLGLHVEMKAQVDAHWHFKGARFNIYLAGHKIGNACPPGGGLGGDIGGHGETSLDGAASLRLTQVPTSGELAWALTVISPQTVNMTLSIGFQHIGDLGIPQSFNVPLGQVAKGRFPLLLLQNGKFSLPGGGERTYKATLTPVEFQTSGWGVVAGWKSQLAF